MVKSLGMEVRHPTCTVRDKGEPEPPVQGDVVILQHVIETSLGAVFTDDARIEVLDCCSDKLAQVWVVKNSIIER